MTLKEYRIQHSMLLEQYQWIEAELESIYAAFSEDPFHEALVEIEKDTLGGVVREIKRQDDRQGVLIFTRSEYEMLDALRERRNFWCHKCYTEPCDEKTGVPQNANLLSRDLQEAKVVADWLRQMKERHMAQDKDE